MFSIIQFLFSFFEDLVNQPVIEIHPELLLYQYPRTGGLCELNNKTFRVSRSPSTVYQCVVKSIPYAYPDCVTKGKRRKNV